MYSAIGSLGGLHGVNKVTSILYTDYAPHDINLMKCSYWPRSRMDAFGYPIEV